MNKPLRILHVGNFTWFQRKHAVGMGGVYYTCDRKISNGLVRNGHNVLEFSHRDIGRHLAPLRWRKKFNPQNMNDALIEQARLYQPDLLLLGHSELVMADTLEALRGAIPHCRIAQWWVDWFTDKKMSHMRPKLHLLDAFFATSAPSYYRQKVAVESIPPHYYLPNPVDSSIETERSFAAAEHDYDLLFIGRDAGERAALLARLQQMPGLRQGFFAFGGRPELIGREFISTIGKSKMGLNLSRAADIPLYSSDRLAQLTGNGILTLTPRTPQMDLLYSEDEVAYYGNEDELLSLIEKYNTDDKARREVAEAGWRRAHESYNVQRVAKFIVEAAVGGGEFSERYEWVD